MTEYVYWLVETGFWKFKNLGLDDLFKNKKFVTNIILIKSDSSVFHPQIKFLSAKNILLAQNDYI